MSKGRKRSRGGGGHFRKVNEQMQTKILWGLDKRSWARVWIMRSSSLRYVWAGVTTQKDSDARLSHLPINPRAAGRH